MRENGPVFLAVVVLIPLVLIALLAVIFRMSERGFPRWVHFVMNGYAIGYFIHLAVCALLYSLFHLDRFSPTGDLRVATLLPSVLGGMALGGLLYHLGKRQDVGRDESTPPTDPN